MSKLALRHVLPVTLVALAALCLAARPATAKRLDGLFTAVLDANVVVLDYGEGSYDIRIYGTEAPADGQPFAAEAKAFVREALLGKNGGIRFKYRNAKSEMVARVFYRDSNGNERDLALDLVSAGLAWIRPGAKYKSPDGIQVDDLTAAGLAAQAARRGIWSTGHPVAPWIHRGETLSSEPATLGFPGAIAGTTDVNISKVGGSDNECAIVKHPGNPLKLAAHCNSDNNVWISSDGGATWTLGGSVGGSYCCDPNLAWDKYGNLYATILNNPASAIVTSLSVDGGASFSPLASFGSGGVDQPTVVANNLASGGVALWIVWNDNGSMVARGAFVTGLGVANVGAFGAQQAIPNTSNCSFGDLAVAPSGAVVQVCGSPAGGQGPSELRVNTDPDGLGTGAGFGASVVASTTQVGGFDFIPAQNNRSVDPEAGLAFDRNPSSPHYGRLYLIYTDETAPENHDLNIMIRHSDNNGATWSGATKVNSDATTRSQFLPRIASDPVTGNVVICWHDARNSATNVAMEVFCDRTTPSTYPAFAGDTKMSDGASLSTDGAMDFGDYSGLTLTHGTAHAIWADSSNSTGNNPSGTSAFDAYTDKVSVPSASVGLYDRSTGRFHLRNQNSAGAASATFVFGPANLSWVPLAGNWDGDVDDSTGLFDPATSRFYLRNQLAGGAADATFQFGPANAGWVPIAGDWDGDGDDNVGLYNPVTGRFYLRNQLAGGAANVSFQFGPGNAGWMPIAGDWDGDGDDNVGLFDPVSGKFYLRNQLAGGAADVSFQFGPGNSGWLPIAGDWNGDGKDTIALYDRAAGKYYLKNLHAGGAADLTFLFGPAGTSWFPLAGNWDGQ